MPPRAVEVYDASTKQLLARYPSISAAAAGVGLSTSTVDRLVRAGTPRGGVVFAFAGPPSAPLTKPVEVREHDTLRLVARYDGIRQVAEALGVTYEVVKNCIYTGRSFGGLIFAYSNPQNAAELARRQREAAAARAARAAATREASQTAAVSTLGLALGGRPAPSWARR